MSIQVSPLGAGQEVGRSCVIVKIKDVTIMFDCGVHMAHADSRKFPDFIRLFGNFDDEYEVNPQVFFNLKKMQGKSVDSMVDLIVITHFHLDHCASLPFLTEYIGYSGPIITTQPTKSIMPLMLEDFRRIISDIKGEEALISSDDIKKCISKIKTIELGETLVISNRIKVTAYYGGHVLGACMYLVEVDGLTALYTGDFNTTPDYHLRGAFMPKIKPDVFITESTKADTIRDTKRVREREFLEKIQNTLNNKGKVLIPVFALGRAQELCVMLDSHWRRNKIKVPIYFTGNLAEKATFYYKLFVNWTNQKVQNIFTERNVFDFTFVEKGDSLLTKADKPMVIFATPGMLHGGLSLSLFCELAGDPRNTVIIPGYCIQGTPGHKILSGERELFIDNKTINVRCDISYMSFSAHADAKGILGLIKQAAPKNVVLVHGDVEVMRSFYKTVTETLGVYTKFPANHSTIGFHEDKLFYRISLSKEVYELVNYYYNLCRKNLKKGKVLKIKKVGQMGSLPVKINKIKKVRNTFVTRLTGEKNYDGFLAFLKITNGEGIMRETAGYVKMEVREESIIVSWELESVDLMRNWKLKSTLKIVKVLEEYVTFNI